jgi:hypothetical protein
LIRYACSFTTCPFLCAVAKFCVEAKPLAAPARDDTAHGDYGEKPESLYIKRSYTNASLDSAPNPDLVDARPQHPVEEALNLEFQPSSGLAPRLFTAPKPKVETNGLDAEPLHISSVDGGNGGAGRESVTYLMMLSGTLFALNLA